MHRRDFLQNGLLLGTVGLLPEMGLTNELFGKAKTETNPLIHAVAEGKIDVVKALVQGGADVNAKDRLGITPLHAAIWRNKIDIAKFLIANGADVNAKDNDGFSPLHDAAMWCDVLEITQLLVANGADVHAEIEWGGTALDFAKAKENTAVADYLLTINR